MAGDANNGSGPGLGHWLWSLVLVPLAGLVGIAFYARSVGGAKVFGAALLVAAAAWIAGGVLGFLFAIPRASTSTGSSADESSSTGLRSNSNLVEISDWLTKILVGLGLVELGRLSSGTRRLSDFLAPSLGDATSSPSFAFAIMVLFSASGFLAMYLVTRVYVGVLFARTEMSLGQYVTTKVVETQRAQAEKDAQALALVRRQLEPSAGAPEISQKELDTACDGASPLVKSQIFHLARDRRRAWDADKVERTAPVFHALIATDHDDRYHRNHAQLAYVLKDKRVPDYQQAERELTTAIEIRQKVGDRGFLLYELNRAICRIHLDAPTEQIRADLAAAAQSRSLRERIATTQPTQDWLANNNLTVDQL